MALTFSNLNITVNRNDNEISLIENFDLVLEKNEILVIQGQSGCGKSTFLKTIAGFIPLTNKLVKRKWFQTESSNIRSKGKILIDGDNISDKDPRERGIGYLMQNTKIYPHLRSPKEVLLLPRKINPIIKEKYSKEKFEEKAREIFSTMKFELDFEQSLNNISGGEEQRLSLAKYMLVSPKILLLDEPFSNLDFFLREQLRTEIYNLVKSENNDVQYVIMVSHDKEDCRIADKIMYFDSRIDKIHILQNDDYESCFEVFSRLYGNWNDKDGKLVKDSFILDIISKVENKRMVDNTLKDICLRIGLSEDKTSKVLNSVSISYKDDRELELRLKQVVLDTDKASQLVSNKLLERSRIILKQIIQHIIPVTESSINILDIGCGDCLVSLGLKKHFPSVHISLFDIYEEEKIASQNNDLSELYINGKLPYSTVELGKKLPYKSKSFDTSLLLTVLHHSIDPIVLLKEAKRVTKSRIIVIESVLGIPEGETATGIMKNNKNKSDWLKYARLVDWFYNRIIFDDIEVPYNFKSVPTWKGIFQKLNLEITHEEFLGIDIDIVPEYHHLFVLNVKD